MKFDKKPSDHLSFIKSNKKCRLWSVAIVKLAALKLETLSHKLKLTRKDLAA